MKISRLERDYASTTVGGVEDTAGSDVIYPQNKEHNLLGH
jgi:hypothetical protein